MNSTRLPEPSRRSAVDPFRAMDVLATANRMKGEGLDVISLAVGQPSAPAPTAARAAARAAIDHGRIGYTDALGVVSLRRRISRHYLESYGVQIDAGTVMVTTGSSAGFNLAFLAAFDVGDRVAIASPGYPAYRNILKALGIVPVEIPVGAEDGYVLTAARLAEEHSREALAGILVASPANPTGTVTPREELKRLVDFTGDAGIRFISDEIYHGLVYGKPAASALEFSDAPIVVNSFSKYYLMTGWRIGWLVLPSSLTRAAERIGQNLYISAPAISQEAGEAAFDARDELEDVRRGYEPNRDLLMRELPLLGFSKIAPIDGAFYAYAAVPEGLGAASELCRRILAETHVAVTPGIDFDPVDGESFIRFSYACGQEEMKEAVRRLRGFFG